MSRRTTSIVITSMAAGAVAGVALGRSGLQGLQARRILNGNYGWMNSQERRLVRTLIAQGHHHLFSSWPKPGVRDGEKRQLLRAASEYASQAPTSLETARLQVLAPPAANKVSKELQLHNDLRLDDYYWLRDDARKDKDVIAYLEAENSYTNAVLQDTLAVQEVLYKEMRGRIQEADQSVATRYQGYYYYTRTNEGQQYAVHCRRKVPPTAPAPSEADMPDEGEEEEIILDENKRKESGKWDFYMVGDVETSPNQQLMAWTEDTMGGEKYTLHVKDLASGKEVMEPIHTTSGDVMWANDNATLFYIVKDHLDRPYKVLRHKVGQPASSDVVVYEESDEAFYVGMGRSHSDKLLYIHLGSAITSETLFLSADDPEGAFRVILPRVKDVEYSVSHHPGSSDSFSSSSSSSSGSSSKEAAGWFLITYRDKERPNSELRVSPLANPGDYKVLLPHRADVKIESASLGLRWLVVGERARAQQFTVVYQLQAWAAPPESLGQGEKMEFDEPAYTLSGGLPGDFDSDVLRLRYASMTTPSSVIDHDMASGRRKVKKVQPVLGGFNKEDYTTERMWVQAGEGVEVPLTLAYRKGLAKLGGSDPMLLLGYGSYEHPYDPSFSSNQLSLMDRGFLVGIAHIRGGGDMGRQWYQDGKYLKKINTFNDFIACAEHLIKHKYTSPSQLCISGRSAGGLLMGAVTNMRPDLFNAVIAGVPFVDALTTMLDETIPLTTIEFEEWGNPKEPEYYSYMKSYSPVDNVKPQQYPNILVTAGLHDPRVGYWEPAKWVAKLRANKTDSNLLLLKTELGAGHFSVTGRFERLKEVALEYAFLLKTQGMLQVAPTPGSGAAASEGGSAAAGTDKTEL